MPLPVVAVGFVAIIKAAMAYLASAFFFIIMPIFSSLIGKVLLSAIFFYLYNYYVSINIDALGWAMDKIVGDGKFSDLPISFTALGTILQALRIDDILLVYINAYAIAFGAKMLLNSGVSSQRSLPPPQ